MGNLRDFFATVFEPQDRQDNKTKTLSSENKPSYSRVSVLSVQDNSETRSGHKVSTAGVEDGGFDPLLCDQLLALTEDQYMEWQERSAIIEFDGGLTHAEAEHKAWEEITKLHQRNRFT